MNQTTPWLDTLSAGQAPEIPAEFLGALRSRRRQGRVRFAAGVALVVVAVFVVAWQSQQPELALPVRQVAQGQPETVQAPEMQPVAPPAITLAVAHAAGHDLDVLAATLPAGHDRALRIGDHWDPSQVEAWVLD